MSDDVSEAAETSATVQYKVGEVTYSVSYETTIITLPTLEAVTGTASADFVGWSDGTTTYAAGASYDTANGTSLTAAYRNYTITYIGMGADGAETKATATAMSGSTVELGIAGIYAYYAVAGDGTVTEATAETAGYQLAGWTIGGTAYELGAEYKVTGDVTVTAVYNAGYTVKFVVDGTVIASFGPTIKALDVTAPTPAREGYTFSGWDADGDGKADTVTKTVTADATYTALFAADTIVVTLDVDGVTRDVAVLYGTALAEPKLDEGYAYWSLAKDGEPYDFDTVVTAGFVLYAIAEEEPEPSTVYTIVFVADGTVLASCTSDNIASVTAPSKDGYAFAGWAVGTDIIKDPKAYVYTADTVLTAVYEEVDPPAAPSPAFYETTAGQVAIILAVMLIMFVGYLVYVDAFGIKTKLKGLRKKGE